MKNKIDKISSWIKEKVDAAGCKGVVFGLSGGIDSAVVAALCTKSISKEKIFGIILPCKSQEDDKEDAFLVAKNLGIHAEVVYLDNAFDGLIFANLFCTHSCQLANANLKARLRMATLYYIANEFSYMVVGTGNKTEIMVGYYTKYGDGGVDLEPIGGLYKTQVFEMARVLGLPEKIINKAPSAGLWAGQTDEKEMGITYKELDKTLKAIDSSFNGELWKEYCEREGISTDNLNKVSKMINASKHKREMPPSCPLEI